MKESVKRIPLLNAEGIKLMKHYETRIRDLSHISTQLRITVHRRLGERLFAAVGLLQGRRAKVRA